MKNFKPYKALALQTVIAIVALAVVRFFVPEGTVRTVAYIVPLAVLTIDLLADFFGEFIKGRITYENLPICVASLVVVFAGYPLEALLSVAIYRAGIESVSYLRAEADELAGTLTDIIPNSATVIENGREQQRPPEEIEVGSIILVRQGEMIPIDGVVVEGRSTVNMSSINSGSGFQWIDVGDNAVSGSVNSNSMLKIRTTVFSEDSTLSQISTAVESAVVDRDKRYITAEKVLSVFRALLVLGCAAMIILMATQNGESTEAVKRIAAVIPLLSGCAVTGVLSSVYIGAVGNVSRKGVLIKSYAELDRLAKCTVAVFGKTGTLTKGKYELHGVSGRRITGDELIQLAAEAECCSEHPVAREIRRNACEPISQPRFAKEIPHFGVCMQKGRELVMVGKREMLERQNIPVERYRASVEHTTIYVAERGVITGQIILSETVKQDVPSTLENLRNCGIRKMCLFTGDDNATAEAYAKRLKMDEYCGNMLPAEKARLIRQMKESGDRVLFIGKDSEDAEPLCAADVGVAIEAVRKTYRSDAAGISLIGNRLTGVADAMRIARMARRVFFENILLACVMKSFTAVLALTGYMPLVATAAFEAVLCVLTSMNASRCLREPAEFASI